MPRNLPALLLFVSGLTALVFEVLWMKELSLLFGNTAHAAATTLAAFFLGMAVGGLLWGRLAPRVRRPLRVYGYLEAGVAVTALLYFLLLDLYRSAYGPLFSLLGHRPGWFLLAKFLIAMTLLVPPALFMGGTLPMISQYAVREVGSLGRKVSALYAVNTLGGALGAYVAGFHLPLWLGFDGAYGAAIAVATLVAIGAIWAGGKELSSPPVQLEAETKTTDAPWLSRPVVISLAFISGFGVLALEVLWTRMFAQVLQNSVYTFSIILVTFLVCLACGAGLAHFLFRRRIRAPATLLLLMCGAGLFVALTPFLFVFMTDGLSYLGKEADWPGYVRQVFAVTAVTLFPPCILLGTLFPFMLKHAERHTSVIGAAVGYLSAVNIAGAMLGSLCAGFVLIDLFGLWTSMQVVAGVYIVFALLLVGRRKALIGVPVLCLLLLVFPLDGKRLPVVRVSDSRGERLLDVQESGAGTVAVLETKGSLRIKLNNHYGIGASGSAKLKELQTIVQLSIHPDPKEVFHVGMGTGISAGAVLRQPVERLVICEVVPGIVRAAEEHFGPYVNGLFEDPRVEILFEDGRNVLAGSEDRYDVIVADLFVPWRAGVGTLYTREHYETALRRLRPGGHYTQWLPMFQLTGTEFGIIARTMMEVFPRVTVWRGDFAATTPILALVGHRDRAALPREVLDRRIASPGPVRQDSSGEKTYLPELPLLSFYGGNLDGAPAWIRDAPVNTDNRPLVEYLAPRSHRRERADQSSWFVGTAYRDFLASLIAQEQLRQDPLLALAGEQHLLDASNGWSRHEVAFQESDRTE